MEPLSRFDAAEYNGVTRVVVDPDLLPPDASISEYPAVRYLNPETLHNGERLVPATRLMAGI